MEQERRDRSFHYNLDEVLLARPKSVIKCDLVAADSEKDPMVKKEKEHSCTIAILITHNKHAQIPSNKTYKK